MNVSITKQQDGGSVLQCVRADGSSTWQKHSGRQAHFFPLHDLTHFAVETQLEFTRGFYGLIADGWDIDDTTGKGNRGPVPAEAIAIEHIVSLLDQERGGVASWSADEFNARLEAMCVAGGVATPRRIGAGALDRVRKFAGDLHGRWAALAPGSTLTLTFESDHP
jgi:hypothetical protein